MKFSILLHFLVFASTLMYSQVNNDSLKCYLPFSGDSLDESGNENHAIINGATLTEDRLGNSNSAYFLDGFENYIKICNSNITNYKEATISFWFKPFDNLNENSEPEIFLQSDVSGDTDGHFLIGFNRTNCLQFPSTNDGKINFEVQGDSVNANSENCSNFGLARVSSNKYTWENIRWHMITLVVSNGELKIFVDSELENTYNSTSGVFVENQDIFIGGYINFGGQENSAFHGAIDDIKIYNRVLSDDEIKNQFESASSTLEVGDNRKVFAFPNPFYNELDIKFNNQSSEQLKVLMYDIKGKLVYNGITTSNSHRVNTHIQQGSYVVLIMNDSNLILGSSIVVKL